MKPTIRPARPGDEEGLHESHMRSIREVCVKDHGEEETRGWGNRPLGDRWKQAINDGYVWLIEVDNEIKGNCYIRILEEHGEKKAHIYSLYLTPEVLHHGLGYQLAQLMIQKAKELRVPSITLDSSLTAHTFYHRLGFQDTGPMQTSDIGGSQVRSFPMILHLNN